MRTRLRTGFATDRGTGVGRNFLVADYLRSGTYQVTVQAQGASAGPLGLRLDQAPVADGGVLRPGAPARISLAQGQAVGDPIVFPDEKGVQRGERHLFVRPDVTRQEERAGRQPERVGVLLGRHVQRHQGAIDPRLGHQSPGDPEPQARIDAESDVIACSDVITANSVVEMDELATHYGADGDSHAYGRPVDDVLRHESDDDRRQHPDRRDPIARARRPRSTELAEPDDEGDSRGQVEDVNHRAARPSSGGP